MKNTLKTPIPILQDTREQDPLLFQDYPVKIFTDTLSAGDYSLVGHDQPNDDYSIIIERKKNCSELVTNLGSKWETFIVEAERLQQYKHRQIVVCGPNNFEYLINKNYTTLSLNFIYKRLSILTIDYGIPVIFCPDRSHAENYIFRLFKHVLIKMDLDE